MNILITGGFGYVGARVADHLHRVRPGASIDLAAHSPAESVPAWSKDMGRVLLELADKASLTRCLEKKIYDVIIHCAAVNEIVSAKDPELAEEVNHQGTARLLELALKQKVKKIIYFSTFHVYEKGHSLISENTPLNPEHPYALTHFLAEEEVRKARDLGLECAILRLSNSYGYPMDKDVDRWTLAANDLCRQAVLDKKIKLKTPGRQYRDFIPLKDVARAVEHLLFAIPGQWKDGLFNLGGECLLSIKELAEQIRSIYQTCYGGSPIPLKVPGCQEDFLPERFVFSIDKLKNTGFSLAGKMEEEIAGTMKVCEEFL